MAVVVSRKQAELQRNLLDYLFVTQEREYKKALDAFNEKNKESVQLITKLMEINVENLQKMAGDVRTGGKGSVRRANPNLDIDPAVEWCGPTFKWLIAQESVDVRQSRKLQEYTDGVHTE
ncbi:structural maintenance of chromosomes protein 1A-like protein isoform X1 [Tanacetum coccineum]